MTERRELSYDGRGINGPDIYRTRVATFANSEVADHYGPLFETAPQLLATYEHILKRLRCGGVFAPHELDTLESLIELAKPKGQKNVSW